jgi:hypothetical protein
MSQNGDQQVRNQEMAYARHKARDLSLQGLSAHEIVAHIDGDGLNATERDLLWRIASQEVASTGAN